MNNWTVLNKDYVLPILLVSVIDLEEGASVVDGELRDDRNRPKYFAMTSDVVAIDLRQDAPGLEASVYHLVTRMDTGLHPLVGGMIAGVVWALHLVSTADVAIVGLDMLARLEEVGENIIKDVDICPGSGGVRTPQPPPKS